MGKVTHTVSCIVNVVVSQKRFEMESLLLHITNRKWYGL